jgi:hypothetical protein
MQRYEIEIYMFTGHWSNVVPQFDKYYVYGAFL